MKNPNKQAEYCGVGECHWCHEKRKLYDYEFFDALVCKECMERVTPEEIEEEIKIREMMK
jgi:hypothetical protein